METIGNKPALLFPMCSIRFHFSSLSRLKILLLNQLSFSTDRKVVMVLLVVFTFFPEAL